MSATIQEGSKEPRKKETTDEKETAGQQAPSTDKDSRREGNGWEGVGGGGELPGRQSKQQTVEEGKKHWRKKQPQNVWFSKAPKAIYQI